MPVAPPPTGTSAKVALFGQFFSGLSHVYGTYDPLTGQARQVKAHVTQQVLLDHLTGRQPYGVYLLVSDRTRAVVVDFDTDDLNGPVAYLDAARAYDLPTYIERSKSKGYHIWTFLDAEGVLAAKARVVVRHLLDEIDERDIEVFPKQDRLDGQTAYGNFIYAPLFGRLVPKGRTVFLDPGSGFKPYPNQWAVLANARRVGEDLLDSIIEMNDLGQMPKPVPANPAAPQHREGPALGLLPCAQRMLAEGVCKYQRLACFRLALQLRKAGLPVDIAIASLQTWAHKNRPADGRRVITGAEVAEQTKWAYAREYHGCGCEDPAVRPFCRPECPLRRRRSSPAAARQGNGPTDQLDSSAS